MLVVGSVLGLAGNVLAELDSSNVPASIPELEVVVPEMVMVWVEYIVDMIVVVVVRRDIL